MVPAARVRGGWIRRQATDHAPHRLVKALRRQLGARRHGGNAAARKLDGRARHRARARAGTVLDSRAARCVYETAVRNGKARGHNLPPSLREIDEFFPPGECWMGTSSSHRAD